jgi:hypothetical protein
MPAHAEGERVVLDAALAQVAHAERDAHGEEGRDEDQHPRSLAERVDAHRVVEREPGRVLELARRDGGGRSEGHRRSRSREPARELGGQEDPDGEEHRRRREQDDLRGDGRERDRDLEAGCENVMRSTP